MKTRILFTITGTTGLVGLLACSNPRIETAAVRVVPMPTAPDKESIGKVCQIGGPSCLEMDERPFETCLLSSQHCSEKLRESARRGESFGLPPPGPTP